MYRPLAAIFGHVFLTLFWSLLFAVHVHVLASNVAMLRDYKLKAKSFHTVG